MSMVDIFIVAIFVFAFSITIVTLTVVNESLLADPTIDEQFTPEAKAHLERTSTIFRMFDGLIVFLLFGSIVASMISAFMIKTHPAFFIASFIFQVVMVAVSTVLSNTYYNFAIQPEIAAVANTFPFMALIMNLLPVILTVVSFILAIIMYGRNTGGDQYAYSY